MQSKEQVDMWVRGIRKPLRMRIFLEKMLWMIQKMVKERLEENKIDE